MFPRFAPFHLICAMNFPQTQFKMSRSFRNDENGK